jgi:pimeloyl-ACP methyl ester carboxylesterase
MTLWQKISSSIADANPLTADVRGNGARILFVNGLGGQKKTWEALRRHLGDFTTITFDLPGCGAVSPRVVPPSIGTLADMVAAMLHDGGHDRVHVAGYSFGGAVAQELAIRHPERVASLVLMCTTFAGAVTSNDPRVVWALASTRRFKSPLHYERVAARLLGGKMRTDTEFRERYIGLRFDERPSVYGYWSQIAAAAAWTSWPRLRRVRAPMLIIRATDDPIVPWWHGPAWRWAAPTARQVVLHGGHLLPLENPALVADVLREHVDRVESSGSPGD